MLDIIRYWRCPLALGNLLIVGERYSVGSGYRHRVRFVLEFTSKALLVKINSSITNFLGSNEHGK
jgi:hypothetical protein